MYLIPGYCLQVIVVINWLINYPQADNNRDTGASEGTRTSLFW